MMQIEEIVYPFPVQTKKIKAGVELAYMDVGKPTHGTLVFIHGLANYSPVWKFQLQQLQSKYRCIAIDLPGNGMSASGDFLYTMAFYVECIKQLCDELRLEKYTLIGHSMGGQIAQLFALLYPENVKNLTLIAPAGIEYFSPLDKLLIQNLMNVGEYFYSDSFHIKQAIMDGFYQESIEKNKIIADLVNILSKTNPVSWRQMLLKSINAMLTEQVGASLAKLTIPVTVVFGAYDSLIPNKLLHPGLSLNGLIDLIKQSLPHAKAHVIPNAGHFVQIENWAEVNKIIAE